MVTGLIATLLLACGGCADPPTPEERVRQTLQVVTQAAAKGDLKGTVAPISHRYQDEDGLNRDQLKGLLFSEFRKHGPITSILGEIDVTLEQGQAIASFDASLASGVDLSQFDVLPDAAQSFHFVVTLEEEEDAWRIIHHEREPLSLSTEQ